MANLCGTERCPFVIISEREGGFGFAGKSTKRDVAEARARALAKKTGLKFSVWERAK